MLAHARADTEVIAVLDGAWADPVLPDLPQLRVTHSASVIGQRAATNLAARMSTARYVMKLDAHCSVAEGFDVALIAAAEELGPDVTQIPQMRNLHVFNRKCKSCGHEMYQGPTHVPCEKCQATAGYDRVVIWQPRPGTRTEFWRFDHDLHFQYWHDFRQRPAAQGDLVDVMSSVGACFFMARDRFFELGGLDEGHGSWGQFGTEIACKSWLSGGRHVTNRRTWFAHCFRTQGGDFGFPYLIRNSEQEKAREYSRKLWLENAWPGQRRPLSWLVEKFAPLPGWHGPEGVEALARVTEAGRRFSSAGSAALAIAETDEILHTRGVDPVLGTMPETLAVIASHEERAILGRPSVGLAYYSDCRGDQTVLDAVLEQIGRARPAGSRFAGVTLAPLCRGQHEAVAGGGDGRDDRYLVLGLERGYLTMFKQILQALELLDAEIIFHVEHDVLYHPSHFEFVPPRRDTFYYNRNTWRVDAKTGRALHYLCDQVSGLCAYRDILIDHYRKRIAHVEQHGFARNLGFEPGTNRLARELDGRGAASWMSPWPNVDIKTEFCLTPGRWSQEQFRNKNSCLGWTEADAVPGWGKTAGRFAAFLEGLRDAQSTPAA